MKTSQEGIELIKQFEGFVAAPYLCPAGKWTIGYGHVIGAHEDYTGKTIDETMGEALLAQDVVPCEQALEQWVRVRLRQASFDALVSFIYNVGVGAFRDSTLLKRLNAGAYREIPGQLRRWVNVRGEFNAGLARRRQAEADLFCKKT